MTSSETERTSQSAETTEASGLNEYRETFSTTEVTDSAAATETETAQLSETLKDTTIPAPTEESGKEETTETSNAEPEPPTKPVEPPFKGAAIFDVKNSAFPTNTKIAVLCGGKSAEREVSLRSGHKCYEALKRLGYFNVVLIDVSKKLDKRLRDNRIEVAFLATHGKYGEDGCVQGFLEMMEIPYTGNRVKTSAITMDKAITKILLKEAGLPVLDTTLINTNAGQQQELCTLNYNGPYPVFVKPLGEGSSVGMSKVEHADGLEVAIQKAQKYSDTVMIEPFIHGKDLTVGVIEINGEPVVMPILEIRPKEGWYDETAKYTAGKTDFILPAEISDNLTKAVQDSTLKAHEALGCTGLSRTDFVMDAEGRFYILEINTIPGMTDLSDLPAQVRTMGMGYDQLVHHVLQSASSKIASSKTTASKPAALPAALPEAIKA